MALVVNSNVASVNAQRNLASSQMGLQKSFERLSSGLRIVRAGDDAAGLGISEPRAGQPQHPGRHLAGADRGGRAQRDLEHADPHA